MINFFRGRMKKPTIWLLSDEPDGALA